ncbi:MAG: 16S rRNA (guanine(527)-N(7))-methyltransferase RsmG [Ignavibacteria bacterium GWF2_33_9]|nr:MAG: 16S rRNA (guanine(527)-N(7))-methyltransferase RsmG [Ignavibacteria bacterium GWF2_33_9]
MNFTEFWTICSTNNIFLDDEQLDNLNRFYNEMTYWNEKVNMISRRDIENLLENHILHSLSILKFFNFPAKAKVLDVGTGGGFPGTPLKIAKPDIYLTLVDSISKKLKIADMLAKHTGLRNIESYAMRVEELKNQKKFINFFDVIVTRAVATTDKIYTWTKDLLKDNGKIILWKGGNLDEEIANLLKINSKLKVQIVPIDLFGFDYYLKEDKKFVIISI